MPTLWYHTGPVTGIRQVDDEQARRDVAAGIAQDMKRPGGPLKPRQKRGTYATRDMQASAPAAEPPAPAPTPDPAPESDTPHKAARKRAKAADASAEVGTHPASDDQPNTGE